MTPVRWRLLFIGLTTLLLLAASLRAGGPDRYVVSAFNPAGKRGPIFPGIMGRADVPVEQVTIVAEIRPLAAEGAVRGIDEATADSFGLGFSLPAWEGLRDHLREAGFSDEELLRTGLLVQGDDGLHDRFRGRLMFPIQDEKGRIAGFGARALGKDSLGQHPV